MSEPVQRNGSGPSSELESENSDSESDRCRMTCRNLGAGVGSSCRTCLLPRQPIFDRDSQGEKL